VGEGGGGAVGDELPPQPGRRTRVKESSVRASQRDQRTSATAMKDLYRRDTLGGRCCSLDLASP
jgi:hypothetical protein